MTLIPISQDRELEIKPEHWKVMREDPEFCQLTPKEQEQEIRFLLTLVHHQISQEQNHVRKAA